MEAYLTSNVPIVVFKDANLSHLYFSFMIHKNYIVKENKRTKTDKMSSVNNMYGIGYVLRLHFFLMKSENKKC